jgi:hypothetical protein
VERIERLRSTGALVAAPPDQMPVAGFQSARLRAGCCAPTARSLPEPSTSGAIALGLGSPSPSDSVQAPACRAARSPWPPTTNRSLPSDEMPYSERVVGVARPQVPLATRVRTSPVCATAKTALGSLPVTAVRFATVPLVSRLQLLPL